MAGHSHSANIKYRKERVSAAKAKAFSKVARMVTVAAKLGGGDPDGNPRLRLAIEKARMVSMPKDNIERAIKKGTGEGDTSHYEELLFECFAPGGVGVLVEVLTDNRHRTAPEIRRIFDRAGGSLATAGAVSRMFERKAVLPIRKGEGLTEEQLMEVALEVGADDLVDEGDTFQVRCEPSEFEAIQAALVARGLPVEGGEVSHLPKTMAVVDDADVARRIVKCLDALEENDDVQSVCANYDFSDEVLEQLAADD